MLSALLLAIGMLCIYQTLKHATVQVQYTPIRLQYTTVQVQYTPVWWQYTSIQWQYTTCQLPIDDILVFVLILLLMLNIYQDTSITVSILIRSTQAPVHTVTVQWPHCDHTVFIP